MKQRGWIVGVGGLVGLMAAGTGWALLAERPSGLSLEAELAAARREGIPIHPQQLTDPKIPAAENAADLYLKATAASYAITKDKAWSQRFLALVPYQAERPVESLSSTGRKALRALFESHAPAIALLGEAGRRPKLAIPRPWKAGMWFQDTSGLMSLGNVLAARADLRDCEGDRAGAFADLEVVARAGALLKLPKSTVESSARAHMEAMVFGALGRIARRHPEDPEMPGRIRHLVSLLGPPTHLRRALLSKVLDERSYLDSYGSGRHPDVQPPRSLRLKAIRDINDAHLVSYWRGVFNRIPEDPLAFSETRKALKAHFEDYRRSQTVLSQGVGIFDASYSLDTLAVCEAQRRVALTAADVLERWQQDGSLPESPPVLREDPFGEQLRYVATGRGFAVYSLNRDFQDDGGKAIVEDSSATTDIAWHFELPARTNPRP